MRALLLLIMSTVATGGGAVAAIAAGAVQEPAGEEHAFVEVIAPRDSYYVQEPIPLRLRLGLDARFFQSSAIQLFRQQLDLPVQVQAPWLQDLPGTLPLEDDAGGLESGGQLERRSFALNDSIATAVPREERLEDGRTFTVLEIEKSFLPLCAGKLVIPESRLRFAYATRFQEDFINGRVPVDRREMFVQGVSRTLHIEVLPEEGRPPEFTGAVGQFSVQAEAEPRKLRVGESLKVVLEIEGEGNMPLFEPPRLDGIEGFHLYGTIEEIGKARRTVTYDLVPLSAEVKEVPPIPFAFFDSGPPAGYRIVQTAPIPLEVDPLPEGARLPPFLMAAARRAVPGESDIYDLKPVEGPQDRDAVQPLSPALLVSVILSPWFLALSLLTWLRKWERDRSDPDRVRARRAATRFRKRAGRPGTDVADELAEYLSARLHCSGAAVITPDLPARLAAAGVPDELAARVAVLLEREVARRYGAGESAADVETARELVEALEATFLAREERR
ncbi:MAG: hypothetical protein AB1486_02205 [Planctomycetota bacterium]